MITDDEVMRLFEQADPARTLPPHHSGESAGIPTPWEPTAAAWCREPRPALRPLVVALTAAAVLALVAGAVALLRIDSDDAMPITTDPPALPTNGWVAFTGSTEPSPVPGEMGDDVYLVREGESPRRASRAPSTDRSDQVCPAFSPDGRRLAFGQATVGYRSGHTFYEDDAELVILRGGR